MKTLDFENRSDAFVGDSEADGGEFYTPQCYTCKNKIDVLTCVMYLKGIPVTIVLGEQTCPDFLPS